MRDSEPNSAKRSERSQSAEHAQDGRHCSAEKGIPKSLKQEFAEFRLIYTSRDDAISVFEDPAGHLCSVRTDRLA